MLRVDEVSVHVEKSARGSLGSTINIALAAATLSFRADQREVDISAISRHFEKKSCFNR